jgi:glycosyltransferase involved in cell wall biosynthesis
VPLRVAAISFEPFGIDLRAKAQLEALAKRGDDVTVWCRGGEAHAGALRIELVDRGLLGFLVEAAARISRAHLSERFDAVIAYASKDALLVPALLPRLFGAKLIVDLGGLGKNGASLPPVVRAGSVLADALVAKDADQYESLLRLGVPAYALTLVGEIVDLPEPKPREKEPRAREIRALWRPDALTARGAASLLEGFARARSEEARLVLVVACARELRDQIEARSRDHALPKEALRFSDDPAKAITEVHFALSLGGEEPPTESLLEELGSGLPVIAANVRTRLADAVDLVPPDDASAWSAAILRLAKDAARRKELGAAARSWFEEQGPLKQRELFFRAVDFACAEKVQSERRARQAAIEGVKTGARKTPQKH